MSELDVETVNSRLLDGHRLTVTRDGGGRVVACVVDIFDEPVPVGLFNSYLADGVIEVPKDGVGYKISTEGKKRLKARPRR